MLEILSDLALFLRSAFFQPGSFALIISIVPTDLQFFFQCHNLSPLRVSVDFLDLFVNAFNESVMFIDLVTPHVSEESLQFFRNFALWAISIAKIIV